MAWTTPAAPGASVLVTNSYWTTQITNNFNETAPAKVTTKGDLTPATAANSLTRLAVGSNGAVLVADSSATPGVRWSSTGKTASGAIAVNVDISNTLTASANGDSLIQERIVGTFAKSTASSLDVYGLLIDQTNAASSGTGAISNGYALYITPHTIAASNWGIYVSSGRSRLGDGPIYIGDTSNANMTAGITINSSTTDEYIALKTGIAHGATALTETDTFATLKNQSSVYGGLVLQGISSYVSFISPFSVYATSNLSSTTKSTAAKAQFYLSANMISGTGATSIGANANIAAFADDTTTRFILDADGDSHQDVGTAWTNFDDRDDIAALSLLSAHVTRHDDPLRRNFAQWLEQDRAPLEAARIVTFNDDGHHFINWSRANMLVIGAVRQLGDKIQELRAELADNQGKLAALQTRLLPEG